MYNYVWAWHPKDSSLRIGNWTSVGKSDLLTEGSRSPAPKQNVMYSVGSFEMLTALKNHIQRNITPNASYLRSQ